MCRRIVRHNHRQSRPLLRVTLLALLTSPAVAGCAVAAAEPSLDPAIALGKADDGAPSDPNLIPAAYELAVPLEEAPDFFTNGSLNMCGNTRTGAAYPTVLGIDDAVIRCDDDDDACHREGVPGELSADFVGHTIMFDDEGTMTWSASVRADADGAPGTIEPGLYNIDVRLPHLHSVPQQTARGRRAAPGLPASALEVEYEVSHAHGVEEFDVDLDPSFEGARWASLGVFRFDEGDVATVTLDAGTRPVPATAISLQRLTDPNLTDMSWLAYLSANQYSHFWSLGPMLEHFGFGQPGEGERFRQCAEDRRQLRWDEYHAWESGRGIHGDEVEAAGDCAAEWWNSEYADEARAGGLFSITSQFERHLVREVVPGAGIQFFTGGELEEHVLEFKASSTQALYAYNPEREIAVIAFRGTELSNGQLLYDVAADLDFGLRALPEPFDETWGRAHTGFQKALAQVEELLMEKLRELTPWTQIYITGHSLGAALATLMAARIIAEMEATGDMGRYNLGGLYTFGSPRVGDPEFVSHFHGAASKLFMQLARVRNGSDAVTRIPFELGALMDYTHVGPMAYIDEAGTLELAPAGTANRLSGQAVDDHDIVTYYQHVLESRDDPSLAAYDTCEDPW